MTTCGSCKAKIASTTGFCPRCGRPVVSAAPSDATSQHIQQLLTDANLFRMKGNYAAAIGKCTEALQMQPMDPEVHSLLGDIYEKQGNYAEALKWYQMAYELRPDSKLDLAKLQRVEARIPKSKRVEQELTTGYWLQPTSKIDNWIRYIVIFCVITVLVLLMIGIIGWISRSSTDHQASTLRSNDTHGSRSRPNTGVPGQSPFTPNNSSPVTPTADVPVRPEGEQQLLTNLATNPAIMQQKIVVEDVKLDPRTKVVLITFRSTNAAESLSRLALMKDSSYVAAAAFAADSDAPKITVRVLVNLQEKNAGNGPSLVLVGDIQRQINGLDINMATEDQLSQVFGNEWWGPEVTQ